MQQCKRYCIAQSEVRMEILSLGYINSYVQYWHSLLVKLYSYKVGVEITTIALYYYVRNNCSGKITENAEVFPLDKKNGNAIFVKENNFLMSNYANWLHIES